MFLSIFEIIGIILTPIVTIVGYIIAYNQNIRNKELNRELEKYKSELASQEVINKMFIEKEFNQVQELSLETFNIWKTLEDIYLDCTLPEKHMDEKYYDDRFKKLYDIINKYSDELHSSSPFIPFSTYTSLFKLWVLYCDQKTLYYEYLKKENVNFINKSNEKAIASIAVDRMMIFDHYMSSRTKYSKKNELKEMSPESKESLLEMNRNLTKIIKEEAQK